MTKYNEEAEKCIRNVQATNRHVAKSLEAAYWSAHMMFRKAGYSTKDSAIATVNAFNAAMVHKGE